MFNKYNWEWHIYLFLRYVSYVFYILWLLYLYLHTYVWRKYITTYIYLIDLFYVVLAQVTFLTIQILNLFKFTHALRQWTEEKTVFLGLVWMWTFFKSQSYSITIFFLYIKYWYYRTALVLLLSLSDFSQGHFCIDHYVITDVKMSYCRVYCIDLCTNLFSLSSILPCSIN